MLNRIKEIMGHVENNSSISLSKKELIECQIVEQQHVAGCKYDSVIDEITNYTSSYIQLNPYNKQKGDYGINGGYWNFKIPQMITQKIDFVEILEIIVEVEDFTQKQNYEHGSGGDYASPVSFIINDKLSQGRIMINAISYNGVLQEYSLRNNLYHEINHTYEQYKRLKNNAQITMFTDNRKYNIFLDKIKKSDDDEFTKMFYFLHYRLFRKSELSAAVSSVYAYLKTINGDRKNIMRDLQKTQAYFEYKNLKNFVENLEKYWGEEWWERKRNLYSKKIEMSPQKFKNWFINRCHVYLNKYFHYMTSAAALYYDRHEPLKEQNEFIKRTEMYIDTDGKITIS